jgi:uncharacterized protein (TIRG00374 family)
LKKKIFKILRFLLFLALALVLLYLAFRGVDTGELRSSFVNARYGYVFLYLLIGFISILSRSQRWVIMIEPLNYKVSFWNSFYSVNTGYLANFAFPRLGEIIRCGSLSKAEKVPVDKLFGTVIVERVIDMVILVVLLFVLVIGRFDYFGNFIQHNLYAPIVGRLNESVGATWILLMILVSIPLLIVVLYFSFRARLSEIMIVQKIKSFIKGIVDGLKTIYQLKRRWSFVFHSLLIWVCYWFMTFAALFILPETSQLKLIDALFLLVVGTLGWVVPVQGGIGAYHYMVVLGFTLYKIPREPALTYATLSHGSQMIMLIVLGAISFLLLFAFQRKHAKLQVAPESVKEHEIN